MNKEQITKMENDSYLPLTIQVVRGKVLGSALHLNICKDLLLIICYLQSRLCVSARPFFQSHLVPTMYT